MFLVITETQGNNPNVRLFEDEVKARKNFKRVKLDKYSQAVYLYDGENPVESRHLADGERYTNTY